MAQFEAAAQAAMDSIPEEFQPYLENTMFIIEETSPEGLLGLYEGATALGAGAGHPVQELARARGELDGCASRRGAPNDPPRGRPPLRDGRGRPALLISAGSRTSGPTG